MQPLKSFILLTFCILAIFAQDQAPDFTPILKAVEDYVKNKTFPSASVIVANSKEVLFSKVFGTFTYNSTEPTLETSPYDIASLTKVVATLPSIVRLYETKKIALTDLVTKYIPEFDNNGKRNITILNLLLHNSGLPASENFYTHLHTPDEVLNAIWNMKLQYKTGTQYIYSCLGFITLGEIVKRVSGKTLDVFAHSEVFGPLEMFRSLYNPPAYMQPQCIPTEIDNYWRHRLVQGTVHDETAALLGGVSGNAGLFSVAVDLAKYMKMWLNKGTFVDSTGLKRQLFSAKTADLFTTKYTGLPYTNTRALGWDTKPLPGTYGPICGRLFSENSFGHTGFTGTSVWADKDKDLIVILLTNRVYPDRGFSGDGISKFRPFTHDGICRVMGYTGPEGPEEDFEVVEDIEI